MAEKPILQLGNPILYKICEPVSRSELTTMATVANDLHDTMMVFRSRHGVGRAIAAPQIGVLKRLLFMRVEKPVVMINPTLSNLSNDMVALWDDCMSFPDLLVKVRRHSSCTITFRDLNWHEHTLDLEGDLSELLQHECDHLDGILAVSRAIDGTSFAYREHLPKSEIQAYQTRISRGIRN